MMNVLCLYNATQTYTNAVFEHLDALGRFSRHRFFFMHSPQECPFSVDLSRFDAVCVHFSIRLPFNQISEQAVDALRNFKGLKFLFIQDEYDNTHRAWYWIQTVGFQLIFTVVPECGIERVYPCARFPNVRFRTNLTGYVPLGLTRDESVPPPSQRSLVVGYRGRPLSPRYGKLGFEKVAIGKMVRDYCERHGVPSDIAWTEDARIYGPAWYSFITSCRAMLGSESGSNVFDWDGELDSKIAEIRKHDPHATDAELYEKVVRSYEIDGIMNQVSPRIFEAIAAHTVLVLFEGNYSGVVRPHEHFIPLKKDGSNLGEVFAKLNDARYVDEMADRAYREVIESGQYSYRSFVEMVDWEIDLSFSSLSPEFIECPKEISRIPVISPSPLTTTPTRGGVIKRRALELVGGALKIVLPVAPFWEAVPEPVRTRLRPMVRRLKRFMSSRGI